ncbi:DUF2304 domain-containing protein [Palaeococcus sp. (in: euryarchaeotes)]|uniref:DUF2304 domain-containing protein n=1 Tax=Palaeococcus sp. (in: euryarchaeotes) TaxID=2820298 RepID=UPI00344E3C9F
MEMLAIQYVTIIVLVALALYVIGKYVRKEFDWREFLSWETLLLIMFVIALKPLELSVTIKNLLGLGRGLDALFVVSIGFAYLLLFRIYMNVDRAEREITELTRKIAIELEEINEKLEKIEKKG